MKDITFERPLIHSFSKYLLKKQNNPGTGDAAVNKPAQVPALLEMPFWRGKTVTNQQILSRAGDEKCYGEN